MTSQPIQTLVFMDFGCVRGDPKSLTEVCLLAVPRNLYLDLGTGQPPTDEQKLLLNFRINGFNLNSYNAIHDFIYKLKKPVCLVSHNGNNFDFPILKRELQNLNVSLSDDVLCADSLYAFYDILEHTDEEVQLPVFEGEAVRPIFYDGYDTPAVSYKLGEIYNRVVVYPPVVPHPAENDVLMKFRISRKLAVRFLAWTDQIQREFADVEVVEVVIRDNDDIY